MSRGSEEGDVDAYELCKADCDEMGQQRRANLSQSLEGPLDIAGSWV